MNAEENRLQTYQTWPDNAPVHPRQLAREGFFATENFLETECFCCHKRIGDWQYGDSITTRHLRLNAECNFLLNPAETGNLPMPIIAQQQQQHSTTNELVTTSVGGCSGMLADVPPPIDYKKEANRLASFANWPNPNITPQELAKAGFYYLNRNDQVHCAWCKGVLARWEKEDNAFEEHMRYSPECPRVLLGPYIELVSDDIRDLGIQQLTPPKRPKFSSLDARLRTYTKWPISDIQRPEVLAQAGFYYHDIDDQVRCFHCLMGLRSWEKEDDPWFEHAKWFPDCQFVRLVKGPTYVQQVQEMTRLNASQQTAAAATETCEDVPPPSRQQTAATSIEEAMESVAVLQALEIGIDVGAIRTAIQRRLELTGRPYDTVENLLKAVFGEPDDDEFSDNVSNDSENTATMAAIVQRIRRLTEIGGGAASSATSSSCISPPSAESHTIGVDVPPSTVNSFSTPPQHTTHHTPTCSSASHSLRDEKPKTTTTTTATTTTNITTKAALPQPEESEPLRNRTLEEENRKLKDARLCKVCLDEEIGVVFLPCGHLVTCVQCAPGVNQCPICRTVIKGFARAFLS